MAGRGAVAPQDRGPRPRVLTLNRAGEWVPAVDPVHFDKWGAGLGRTFGLQIAAAAPRATVGLIPCAVGGSPIDSWKPGALDEATKIGHEMCHRQIGHGERRETDFERVLLTPDGRELGR